MTVSVPTPEKTTAPTAVRVPATLRVPTPERVAKPAAIRAPVTVSDPDPAKTQMPKVFRTPEAVRVPAPARLAAPVQTVKAYRPSHVMPVELVLGDGYEPKTVDENPECR